MEETEKTNNSTAGLNILLSTLLSVLIIILIVYIGRDAIVAYIYRSIEPNIQALVPQVIEFQSDDQLIRTAIATVNPAVVSVIVTKDVPLYERYYETVLPGGWFGGITIPRIRENGSEERQVGGGSGFIVSSDGLIVTNRHVVADEDARYSIVLNDGTVYATKVVARDTQLDIAVIAIDEPLRAQLPVARFGDSTRLELGQTVIAIGNALAEFQNSVSVGVISGLSRSIVASDRAGNTEQLNEVIQTDAAINPGNSGGPLITLRGEVIGVNVAATQNADNIGFALPAALVSQVVDSVKETGSIVRPFLGVRYLMLTENSAKERNLSVTSGALLTSIQNAPAVEENSPAARAGLMERDVIMAIDGVSLEQQDLATFLRTKRANQTVNLTVWREGETFTVDAELVAAE